MIDFKNILYTRSFEVTNLKETQEASSWKKTIVTVTKETNCFLVWCSVIQGHYRRDDDATSANTLLKDFIKSNDAIEFAVDWIRNKKKE